MTSKSVAISVALVDEHRLMRDGLTAIMRSDPEIKLIARGTTPDDAVAIAANYPVSVMVLDVELQDEPIVVTVRKLVRLRPSLAVVVLSMFADELLRRELLRAGAVAFVPKSAPSPVLLDAVRQAGRRRRTFAPVELAAKSSNSGPLTPREVELVRYLARAMTNAQIAQQMRISEATVKRHASNAYRKLGAHSRLDALNRVRRLGLLDDRTDNLTADS